MLGVSASVLAAPLRDPLDPTTQRREREKKDFFFEQNHNEVRKNSIS